MQGRHTARVKFQVRVLTLGQLANLWSMVMSLLPEVNRGRASFKRRGRSTDQDYVFEDADELAQTRFGFRPGELKLQAIHVANADLSIDIYTSWTNPFRGALFALPAGLEVENHRLERGRSPEGAKGHRTVGQAELRHNPLGASAEARCPRGRNHRRLGGRGVPGAVRKEHVPGDGVVDLCLLHDLSVPRMDPRSVPLVNRVENHRWRGAETRRTGWRHAGRTRACPGPGNHCGSRRKAIVGNDLRTTTEDAGTG